VGHVRRWTGGNGGGGPFRGDPDRPLPPGVAPSHQHAESQKSRYPKFLPKKRVEKRMQNLESVIHLLQKSFEHLGKGPGARKVFPIFCEKSLLLNDAGNDDLSFPNDAQKVPKKK
jgi:hypothetical protein